MPLSLTQELARKMVLRTIPKKRWMSREGKNDTAMQVNMAGTTGFYYACPCNVPR